jgi:hypothetical protein
MQGAGENLMSSQSSCVTFANKYIIIWSFRGSSYTDEGIKSFCRCRAKIQKVTTSMPNSYEIHIVLNLIIGVN